MSSFLTGCRVEGYSCSVMVTENKQPEPVSLKDLPAKKKSADEKPQEIGGPRGPEPTRFGDWERKGRCIDF